MRQDQPEVIAEVALWCSLQSLTTTYEDSADETRRRELMHEVNRLLATRRFGKFSLFQRLRLKRARNLMEEADPDTLFAPLEHQLRSPQLKPSDSIGNNITEELRQEIVKALIDLRSSLLKAQPNPPGVSESEMHGRLLIYIPSENVSDGASKVASKGFFDVCDCPPWDLWLRYSNGTLVSWVPEALYPLAQAGIDANPVECIKWAD